MNCADVEALFSDYIENELSAEKAEAVARHVETCAVCHAGLEALRYALGDLHSLSVRDTAPEEVAAIMAAVDRSQAAPVAAPRRPLLTHLVAAGIGALLLWISLPEEAPPAPEIVERIVEVEVPIEVPVQVPVEVPVEVERIVEVEVPVEVPVEVVRTVRVPHPLQLRAHLLEEVGNAFITLADLATATPSVEPLEVPLAALETPIARSPLGRSSSRETARSPVQVVRSGEQFSLRTRGSTEEVVPALIAMLSTEDPRLHRVIEERLDRILGENGIAGPGDGQTRAPNRSATALGGLKALISGSPEATDDPPSASTPERWRTWWRSRGTELAALDLQATY